MDDARLCGDAIVLGNVKGQGGFRRSMGGSALAVRRTAPPHLPFAPLPIPVVLCGLAPPAVTQGRGAPGFQMPKTFTSLPAVCPAPLTGTQRSGNLS